METPVPTSFPRRHKFIFGVIVTISILLYAAFNVWVYRSATSGNAPVTGLNPVQPSSVILAPSPPAKQDPAPRDTPSPTGPGSYACSPEGTCNVYNDETRKQYCTTTYADNRCLDQCGTKENQCKK